MKIFLQLKRQNDQILAKSPLAIPQHLRYVIRNHHPTQKAGQHDNFIALLSKMIIHKHRNKFVRNVMMKQQHRNRQIFLFLKFQRIFSSFQGYLKSFEYALIPYSFKCLLSKKSGRITLFSVMYQVGQIFLLQITEAGSSTAHPDVRFLILIIVSCNPKKIKFDSLKLMRF
jgi:hypothetical protein